ncbi:MAG: superoxide dismutase [Bacillati bacterium ANGP1]|uniref:Superoxide dismutase n=1 Tax=Candidatus Segetimicrobium genomatis TaxID=2569760 RepID=A0A537LN37_9BACT|nr:MAG: superoxide dismutase [Terrabacteria group bacterium ANGP1]TMJ09424.1 MAG: superoxide dismutase [Terrabacteria group bacterium ANGP1]
MPYPFKLPELGYPYSALEPYIDAQTMEIHHGKHHAAYVNNLNAALEKHAAFQKKEVIDLLSSLSDLPQEIQTAVRNNGGGHLNHSLFWQWIKPGGSKEPKGRVLDALKSTFTTVDTFKEQLTQAGMTRFGSGWAWLVVDRAGKLKVYSTANQDAPVMEGNTPALGVDVWEHAYYLKYQNRRADYLKAWWNVVNWDSVAQSYDQATKK